MTNGVFSGTFSRLRDITEKVSHRFVAINSNPYRNDTEEFLE